MHHNDGFEIQELDLSGGQHAKPPKHPRRNILIVTGAMLATFVGIAIASSPGTPAQDAANVPGLPNVVSTPKPSVSLPTGPITTKPVPPKPRPAKALTVGQQNAIRSARSYLEYKAFSRKGLIHQLTSEYGESFSKADATFAVDYLKVDWNAQAAKSAKSYLEFRAFSRSGLIRQLTSEYGEGFTRAQAEYGVKVAGL
jgi:hypothetical protein